MSCSELYSCPADGQPFGTGGLVPVKAPHSHMSITICIDWGASTICLLSLSPIDGNMFGRDWERQAQGSAIS